MKQFGDMRKLMKTMNKMGGKRGMAALSQLGEGKKIYEITDINSHPVIRDAFFISHLSASNLYKF